MVFTECDFSGVNLNESEHLGSAFRNCTFKLTTLWHSTFRQCSMLGSVFERCRMRPLTLDEVDFTLSVLGGNDLRGVDLSGCRLREDRRIYFSASTTTDAGGSFTCRVLPFIAAPLNGAGFIFWVLQNCCDRPGGATQVCDRLPIYRRRH